jgi:fimbrial chaperone protein
MIPRLLAAATAIGLVASLAALAAAPVAVSPTLVTLTSAKQTDLVNLTNQGDDSVRFQLTVEAWDQLPNGEAELKATENVLVFPPLLSLAPHEARKVRVATSVPAGTAEQSYRLSVQELPTNKPGAGQGQVQMLTKLSLPIFVQPMVVRAQPRLDRPILAGGVLSFTIANDGGAHFTVGQVTLTGDDGVARRTFELAAQGWYILAGGRRDYQAVVAVAECRKTTHLSIGIAIDEKTLQATIPITAANCGTATTTRFIAPGGTAASGNP